MAWTIQVTCPSCRFRASLPGEAVLLTLSANRETARYTFICVKCRQSQVRDADSEEVASLEPHATVQYGKPIGPAFTEDDVIDLMLELEGGSWR